MKNGTAGRLEGFTLIELLVVVLIIGILASVALPQYQKAVTKSRLASTLPLLKSIAQAQRAYYMATGQHAVIDSWKVDGLDIEVPRKIAGGLCELPYADNTLIRYRCDVPGGYIQLILFPPDHPNLPDSFECVSFQANIAKTYCKDLLPNMQERSFSTWIGSL